MGAAALAAAAPDVSLGSLLRPAPRALSQNAAGGSLFQIQRVTDGVFAAIARPAAMINCNAAIIVGSDEALVVDAHSKPSAARALIRQIRAEVTDRPVRYVVNSHFHWDHAQGNLAYPEAYGAQTQIVSSTGTREWLEREGVKRLRESLDSLPKQIADLKKQVASAKKDADRKLLAAQVAELEAYLREMTPPEKQIKLPTLTFERRLVMHQGGHEVHLLFLGRGHTAGDVVVYLPGEKAVATGDLMHSVLPYMADGYPDDWSRTLTTLEGLDFDHVVSGHGSVQQGKAVLRFFRSYIDELNENVSRGVERGTILAEVQKALVPERLKSLAAEQVTRLGREVEAAFGPVTNPAERLKGSVAANVADVYNYYFKSRK
jgi:glyoxylase-like metal-dependent hydrolase (beta-lactamase superfamily II)